MPIDDLAQLVAEAAAAGPDRLAVVEAAGRGLTWTQLDEEIDRVATGLGRLGIVAPQRVLLCVGNRIEFVRSPRQDPADRVRIEQPQPGVYVVAARFGFMETPDVNEALKQCRGRGLKLFAQDCSFFLGWHLVLPRPRSGYEGLRRRGFAWMQRRSTQASEFFRMPERRVVVLATQVEL